MAELVYAQDLKSWVLMNIRVQVPLGADKVGFPSWLKGADCKSVATRFDGSNPSPTIISSLIT